MRKLWLAVVVVAGILLTGMELHKAEGMGAPPLSPPDGRETVASRLEQVGENTRGRWKPFFERAGVAYPPQKTLLVGLKSEKLLQIYASNGGDNWRLVRSMPIQKASGVLGPKLKMGDYQVPEGFYTVEYLNPNSRFHLSLRVSYPSAEDRVQAERDGRTNLGGDIMIHGSNQSVGCLAMGDEGAEDVFVLAADTKSAPIGVLLCPLDFRVESVPADAKRPKWVSARYERLEAALRQLPLD